MQTNSSLLAEAQPSVATMKRFLASVVIWSLYNEDWGITGLWRDAERQAWLAELYADTGDTKKCRNILEWLEKEDNFIK